MQHIDARSGEIYRTSGDTMPKLSESHSEAVGIGAVLATVSTMPEAFERNPQGAVIVAGLLIFALTCWVLVTWIKHRRR